MSIFGCFPVHRLDYFTHRVIDTHEGRPAGLSVRRSRGRKDFARVSNNILFCRMCKAHRRIV